MTRIVWLASYPKSGNTWFRVFLANYLSDANEPAHINTLPFPSIASSRRHFDDVLAVDASDFAADEYDGLRPAVYRGIARQATTTPFIKIHDANVVLAGGAPLVPADVTDRAIYLVRDPRDVAISLAHHLQVTPAAAIEIMSDEHYAFCSAVRGLDGQLRQRLLTWSQHFESWTDHHRFPVHLIRYEDMFARPTETFGEAVRFLGLPDDKAKLRNSIQASSFPDLQRQEATTGFREAPAAVAQFFRAGVPGGWTDALSDSEAARVASDHADVMQRLDYCDQRRDVSDSSPVSRVRP